MKSIEHEWSDEELDIQCSVTISEGVEPDSLDILQLTKHPEHITSTEVHLPAKAVAELRNLLLTGRKIHTLKIESWGFNPQGKALGE